MVAPAAEAPKVEAAAPVAATAAAPAPAAEAPKAEAAPSAKKEPAHKDKAWYERINMRGYTQLRTNRLPAFKSNPKLINLQGDRSIGENNNFLIRRARLILFGNMSERVSIYLQPDFASSINDQQHVAILRDWYSDLAFDSKREFRIRVGQSKVPWGFENMQSSQNRLPFDRADATNSALRDERDLGAYFYWAPEHIRARMKALVDTGLKGSGDYGVFALGVYNGQNANRLELNDNLHVVARVTYPWEIGGQVVEAGVAGYTGKYNIKLTQPTAKGALPYQLVNNEANILDQRAVATFNLYPKPFGILAEAVYGVGPSQGIVNPSAIGARELWGGFVTLSYQIKTEFGHTFFPYTRFQTYRGGRKFETNAPRYEIDEIELGTEWQMGKWAELTLAYMLSDRTSGVAPYKQERGHVTRLQLQFNY